MSAFWNTETAWKHVDIFSFGHFINNLKELTKFLINSFYTYFHKLMKKYFFIFVNKVSIWYKKYTDPPQI